MKKLNYLIFALSVIFMISGVIFFISAASSESVLEQSPLVSSFAEVPQIPTTTKLADEKIDLTRYDMYERYDRELTSFCYMHSTTLLIIKRANRYFPIIEPILEANGVPTDFKFLAAIESNMALRAVSPAKAAGLWQLLPTTAQEYGLEVNDYVDERFDVVKSTEAACKYLLSAYQKYGNWCTVAASYNAGMGRISTEMTKQLADNSFDLWLVEETSRYVFRILAMKEVMKNPYRYGFVIKKEQLYQSIRTNPVTITTAVDDLASFAKSQGITYSQLKEFNPWLVNRSLPDTEKVYTIEIPLKEDMYYNKNRKFKLYQKNWAVE